MDQRYSMRSKIAHRLVGLFPSGELRESGRDERKSETPTVASSVPLADAQGLC